MHVLVRKCSDKSGTRKDGKAFNGKSCLVIYNDGKTAERLFISSDICDPTLIEEGQVYDLYKNPNGYPEIFDLLTDN